jgi:hypothetical protein
MLLSEVQRTESGGVINMGPTLAIKKGQNREKAVGFQEMGIFRCDSCGRNYESRNRGCGAKDSGGANSSLRTSSSP